MQGVKRNLEAACKDLATLATSSEPTASEPTASEPITSEPTAKKPRNERKKYPDPCGFSVNRYDDDDLISSFVPVVNGDIKKALDMAYIISLGDGREYEEGEILAVYPTVLSEEHLHESSKLILNCSGELPFRDVKFSRVWHFSPPLLVSLLEKKEADAETVRLQKGREKYTDPFTCFACHPAPSGGLGKGGRDAYAKGCKRSDPPHKMYGDYAKGGCKFPKDLFQYESTSPVEAMSKRKGSLVDPDAEDSTHECLAE